jgi:hypothetical protein
MTLEVRHLMGPEIRSSVTICGSGRASHPLAVVASPQFEGEIARPRERIRRAGSLAVKRMAGAA